MQCQPVLLFLRCNSRTVKAYRCNPPWNKPEDVQMDLFERIILGVARFHAGRDFIFEISDC